MAFIFQQNMLRVAIMTYVQKWNVRYEIVLGAERNTQTIIRRCQQGPFKNMIFDSPLQGEEKLEHVRIVWDRATHTISLYHHPNPKHPKRLVIIHFHGLKKCLNMCNIFLWTVFQVSGNHTVFRTLRPKQCYNIFWSGGAANIFIATHLEHGPQKMLHLNDHHQYVLLWCCLNVFVR